MTITCQPMDATAGAPAYSAMNERQANAPLYGGGSGLSMRAVPGFRVGTSTNVLSATSTTWTLGPCSAVLSPAASSAQGSYRWASDSNVTGSVTAADATYARKDIVYIQVNDSSAGDGSGALTAPVLYLAGTASATPVAPALPNNRCFLVGTVSVPQSGGGSPTVVLNPARFVTAGGIQPIADATEQATLATYEGLRIDRYDLDLILRYDGSKWVGGTGTLDLTGTNYTSLGGGYEVSTWTQTADRMVTLTIAVAHSAGTVVHVAGQKYKIGSVPAAIAPSARVPGGSPTVAAGHWNQPALYVEANGDIMYSVNTTASASFFLTGSAVWRSKP